MSVIGVSIFPPKSGMSPFSNGAHQNTFFLAALLRLVPGVDRVILVNGGDGEPPKPEALPAQVRDIPFARVSEVGDVVDVIIECGAQLEAGLVARVRERGGVAITLKFGNALVIDAEHAIHKLPHGSGIFNGARFDEIWTTDQHAETCGSYWTTCYRAPLRVLPHVWEPWFIDMMTAAFPPGLAVGYRPGRERKRVAVMEPNINIVKTCHVPMLITELAYRQRPDLIDRVLVTNAIHLRERTPFKQFAAALDITRAKADDDHPVMSFEPRFNTPWFLSAHADVLVSHQWISTPVYLHMDAMWLGFPIVHNVEGMPGYRYRGWNAEEGARALIRAMTEYDGYYREERDNARRFLAQRLATAPHNVAAHAKALEEVGR